MFSVYPLQYCWMNLDFFGIYIQLPGTDCQHTQAKLRWQKEYTFVHFERVCVDEK